MKHYSALLDTMMESVLSGDTMPASQFLRDKKNFPPAAQLAIYTEGYRLRLTETLESAYPALAHYLGKADFTKLAGGFIAAHPSRNFNLDKYPVAFAAYVAGKSEDAFARDLSALEGAIHEVYQQEETPAMDAKWAERLTPESLGAASLSLRAAARLLACETPADGYLTDFRAGKNPARPQEKKNWLLVLRHRHQVQRLALEEGEYALLSLLAEGATLGTALEDLRFTAYTEGRDFAHLFQGWFARWINEGILRQPL